MERKGREVGPTFVQSVRLSGKRRVTGRAAFKIFSIINNTKQWAATHKAKGDSNKTSARRKGKAGRRGG